MARTATRREISPIEEARDLTQPVEISAGKQPSGQPRISPYFYYGALLLVIVVFGLIRFQLRNIPLERDEGEYAYGGELIRQGIVPYQLEYTMKFPGTSAMYAAMTTVFGETPAGIHVGLIFVNAATTGFVFLIAWQLFGMLAAVIAGTSYALFSASPFVLGFAGHATHFVVLFAMAGIWVMLKALESDKGWLYFSSGLLFGLAFLMKQPGVAFLLFAGIYVLQQKLKAPIPWKKLLKSTGLLALGSVIPFAATCLIVVRAGLFRRFWFYSFQYAQQYVKARKVSEALEHLFGTSWLMVGARAAALGLFFGVLLGTFLWSQRARRHAFFAISLFLISFAAVCPGFYFRRHYFILLLPAVAILIGLLVDGATEKVWEWRKSAAWTALPVCLFALAFVGTILAQRHFLFGMSELEISRDLYQDSPFPEAMAIARYIDTNTRAEDSIAIVGSEPEIFYDAHRHSATGYIYVYPFLEEQKFYQRMEQEMIGEIEAAHPRVLLFVHIPGSWSGTLDQISDTEIVNWMRKYVRDDFVAEGIAEIGPVSEYHWGGEVRNYVPRSDHYVVIYRRKDLFRRYAM